MTRTVAIKNLTEAFLGLTKKQRDNLKWHAEKGTPILCGKKADLFTDGRGGG